MIIITSTIKLFYNIHVSNLHIHYISNNSSIINAVDFLYDNDEETNNRINILSGEIMKIRHAK